MDLKIIAQNKIILKFLLWLDYMPETWEHRVQLFGAFLIEERKVQSSTLKSYISAIKTTLTTDNYEWDDQLVWLNSLIRSCRMVNDVWRIRLPIQFRLFELLLFEVERLMASQPYLEILYKAIFCLAYYGLLRVSEISSPKHGIRASDVHIAQNKNKLMFLLYSLKTHGL